MPPWVKSAINYSNHKNVCFQVVGPADGSAFVMPYYGARITVIRSDNETYLLPQEDWHNVT